MLEAPSRRSAVRGVALLLFMGGAAGPVAGAGVGSVLPDWSGISAPFFPLAPAAVTQPVLTAADVTDAHATFVADPFLMHTEDLWYLFFEAVVPQGRIALATSADGLHYQYQHIVLAEPFQLSFPSVFRYGDDYYMTPESAARNSVRLYRADPFPDTWVYVADLVKGRVFADPTIFRYANRWWMFVGNGPSDTCWLFSSDALEAGWVEHPMSPIVSGNRGRARPAGRGLVLAGNVLYRLAQNDTPTYGRAVRLFQIDALTPETYAEHEVIDASPIVQASGDGWNADGMHTCDPWWSGDHWLAAVDGLHAGTWSIGIYRAPPPPSTGTESQLPGRQTMRLACTPNPARGAARLHWELAPGGPARRPMQLRILDAAGRVRLARVVPMDGSSSGSLVWNAAAQLPAGVYFCSLDGNGQRGTTRLVVTR